MFYSDGTGALHHYVHYNSGHEDSFFSKIWEPACKWQETTMGNVVEEILHSGIWFNLTIIIKIFHTQAISKSYDCTNYTFI